MVLSAHIVVGAAVASAFGAPELALPASLVSHYAMDAIPHREYEVRAIASAAIGKALRKDLFHVALDIAAGLGLLLLAAGWNPLLLLAGFLAILPDGGSFVYFRLRARPDSRLARLLLPALLLHAKLHNRIHWWKPQKIAWPPALATQGSAFLFSLLTLLTNT